MPVLQFFPFGPGLHQENDNRLQNAGSRRAIENLIRRKNGRLTPRHDYETLGMTGQSGVSAIRLFDLHNYGSRLVAFGRCTISTFVTYTDDANADIFDLVEQPQNVWQRVPTSELSAGTQARRIARIGRQPSSIDVIDVAAGGGLVCIVYQLILRPDIGSTLSVGIMVVDAATDATVMADELAGAERPRVCFVNGSFFITSIVTATNAVQLHRFTPATSSAIVALTSPVAAGASIVAYDLCASVATGASIDTFWIAVARSDTTTALRGCNSAGTVTYTTAGPAVLGDFITVFHHDGGGTQRLHVGIVIDTTLNFNLYTYLPPATAPAVTSLDLFSPFNLACQVGICLWAESSTVLLITFQDTTSSPAFNTIYGRIVSVSAHVLGAISQQQTATLNAKQLNIRGRNVFASYVEEEDGYFTHAIMRLADTLNIDCFRPVCVFDRFIGHELSRAHLPSVAFDASTGKSYVIVSTEDEDRTASPQVMELELFGTDRRQTALLGDVLYISGSIVQAFDGRAAAEAGGFLTRPFISQVTASATPGALDGIYQFIAVAESRDKKNRRMQSAPSNLIESGAIGGGFPSALLLFEPPLTMRDSGVADNFTPDSLQGAPTTTIYRTLRTDDGNGTLHLDLSDPNPRASLKLRQDSTSIQSDTALSDNPILYTQGPRGALSGPLEFVCPDPATSLTASANRILSGGLPDVSRIQESRPLFVGEQCQWNDTLGFFQEARGRVLAVQRLDERRIIFTESELFEADGPGVDDNGLGEIGAPRRLPSEVGLYGGVLGWRSIVEVSAGILFQGQADQIYLLPRGGVTPVPVGSGVEDTLALYPDISAAVYIPTDQTIRFCCNNEAGTESVILLFDLRFTEWFTEGPYDFSIRAAAERNGQFHMLTSDNEVRRQRTEIEPLSFVGNAWRSGVVHPWKPGMMGRTHAIWFYGTFRGNCRIRCIITYDERDTEFHPWVDVFDEADGSQYVYRFEFEQTKCENVQVDFEIESLQSEATRGLDYTYWAIEGESSEVPNEVGPEEMT